MARRRSKRERPKVTVSEGITVSAVKADSGQPATAVEVRLEAERLKRQLGEFVEVEEVVARIPSVTSGGRKVRWEQRRLDKLKEEEPAPGERTMRYSTMHYGPAEAERGVDVLVKTDAGIASASRPGSVREAGKPAAEGPATPDRGRRSAKPRRAARAAGPKKR